MQGTIRPLETLEWHWISCSYDTDVNSTYAGVQAEFQTWQRKRNCFSKYNRRRSDFTGSKSYKKISETQLAASHARLKLFNSSKPSWSWEEEKTLFEGNQTFQTTDDLKTKTCIMAKTLQQDQMKAGTKVWAQT